MSISFRPAVREQVGLWINLIGTSGSGKTYSAMQLASGICGDKPFALIDTENRRGLHYAEMFKFDHADLREPFCPDAYAEAILAADAAGYPVIVIDSGSHVWAGSGGVLDMQEAELQRMAGDDWQKREKVKMAAWIKPKMSHKKMVQKLLQVKAHIILCLRAEEKIEMVKENGKLVIRPKQSLTGLDGYIPVCEKSLPFEATCSFLLTADKPGMPHPIKLQEQHKSIFPLDKPISAESGKRLAEWAAGGKAKKVADSDDTRGKMVSAYNDLGVASERIEAYFCKSVDNLTSDNITVLRNFYKPIKDGRETWESCIAIASGTPEDEKPVPEVSENVSEVTTDTEADNVQKQLIHKLEERVYQVGELQLGKGQKARYGNRANLSLEMLQELLDELG